MRPQELFSLLFTCLLLFGCKGGGDRLFDSGKTLVGKSEISVRLQSNPAVGSIIEPQVDFIDHQGDRFPIDARLIEWNVSDPSIAFYDKSYQALIFIQRGSVDITAKYSGLVSNTLNVRVEDEKVVGVKLIALATSIEIAYSPNMNTGGGRNFYASAEYNNGQVEDVTDIANWSVSDNSVVMLNPMYKGGVLAVAEGLADVIVEYQGYQDQIEIYVYDADITNYPVECGISEIVVLLPEQRKELTFKCPPIHQRIGDYNSTQTMGYPSGIINAILPWFTFQSAERYCEGIGYRLPSWKEHIALRAYINSGITYPYGPYLDYGWPQLGSYWLADYSKSPGLRYQSSLSSHLKRLVDENDWHKVTALCVKERPLVF